MLNALADIARTAGKMMIDMANADVHEKEGHYNFVTDADVAVQEYIRTALHDLLPEAGFFAEEQDNNPMTDAPTFVVDPIDGTTNFSRHRNQSAVSICLMERRTPILACVCQPYVNEIFLGEKGKGATLNGKPLHVSRHSLDKALVSFGTYPYMPELAEASMRLATRFLLKAGDIRRTGSAVIDLCDVASGRSEVFFELSLNPWDVAAGSLLVTEAGGTFLSIGHERPWYDSKSGVLATNGICLNASKEIFAQEGFAL